MRFLKLSVAATAMLAGFAALSAGAVASATSVGNCTPSQISVSLGHSNGAAGTIYYPIVFTNTGATCVIWGLPHIQPVAGSPRVALGPAAHSESMGEMPARHTISKGQSVSVDFGVTESGNFTASTCVAKNATGVRVFIPGFVTAHYLTLKISVCTKRSSTSTRLLTPGSTGI
ncbi:MAG: DUF4232 domain-containing protein [Acidimicrobiales bacterium]